MNCNVIRTKRLIAVSRTTVTTDALTQLVKGAGCLIVPADLRHWVLSSLTESTKMGIAPISSVTTMRRDQLFFLFLLVLLISFLLFLLIFLFLPL